jgi:hypothetical protein
MPRVADEQLNLAERTRSPIEEYAGDLAVIYLQIGDGHNFFPLAAQQEMLRSADDGGHPDDYSQNNRGGKATDIIHFHFRHSIFEFLRGRDGASWLPGRPDSFPRF